MINVNKLFRRLTIRNKLVIAFVLLGVVPLLVVGGYGAVFSFQLLYQSIFDALQRGVSLKAGELQQVLDTVVEDVLSLSRLPTVQGLIEMSPGPPRAAVVPVERAFLAFSQSRRVYSRIRYVDQRGQEVARVDFDGERHEVVPASALQHRSDRSYFREAMAVRPGTVYVSPMEPDDERGKVEFPPKPVVRYAMPLVDSRGERRGIVIVDFNAWRLLSRVLSLGRERGDVSLVDSRGVYLVHSRRASSESGSFVIDARQTLHRDLTRDVAATILAGRPGAVAESGLRGQIRAFAPVHAGPEREPWMLIHAYGKHEVLSSVRSLQILVLVLGAGVLVAALSLGVLAARQFTRPITALTQGAAAIAAGNFDRMIHVDTNDELEDLSRQFNQMARHLKEHERQLVDARARAERKAQEAEALYRLGTEISAFVGLDKILHLVAEKARELLGGDVAGLGLLAGDGQGFVVGATSGPSEAFSFGRGRSILDLPDCIVGPCNSSKDDSEPTNSAFTCGIIRGDYLKAHIAAPLKTRDKVIGALCVGNRTLRQFSRNDVDLLSGLASQAAIAIENARLHRQLRSLAALEERQRISKDLHDGIIQSIYATGLALEDGIQLVDEDPAKAKQRLEQAIEDLNDVIKDVRNYIFDLQPEVLHGKEMGQALADLVKGFKINSLVDAELVVGEGIDMPLSEEQKTHLFHIARETLANVAKHAEASKVRLKLLRAPNGLTFSIEDNGIGLDSQRARAGGHGLRNIAERVKLLGGDFEIKSGVRLGTCLVVTIPAGESPQRPAISSQQEKLVS